MHCMYCEFWDWDNRDAGWAMCSKKGEKVYADDTCEKHEPRRKKR